MLEIDRIRVVEVEDVVKESEEVKSLIFKDKLTAESKPGQFIMVWIPGVGEIPMSVMLPYNYDANEYACISIRKKGEVSRTLYMKNKGDKIGIRGPYGNSFSIVKGSLLMVGGGTGLVPLLRLCKSIKDNSNSKITLIMGAKNKNEVIYESLASSLVDRLIITTDDGSYGIKGFATDPLTRLLREDRFDMVYTCGPEPMIKKVIELAYINNLESEASLERIMKCGIGLCSSCCLGKYILCKDGPVLKGSVILSIEEFGKYYRDRSGRLVPL